MRWLHIVIIGFAFAFALCSGVRADEIGGRVFLPDGKPADRAKVIARLVDSARFGARQALRVHEVAMETDEQGFFDATMPKIYLTAGPGRHMRPYLLVDAPGCALSYLVLTEVVKSAGRPRATIQLERDVPMYGKVIGPGKKPVAGAEVKVTSWSCGGYDSSVLNYSDELVTPQLSARIGQDGTFILRGIRVPNESKDWGTFGALAAVANINGSAWVGEVDVFNRAEGKGTKRETPLILTLEPTVTLSGRLRDAVTGKPLAGVRVATSTRSAVLKTNMLTGADGSFRVSAASSDPAVLRFTQFRQGILNEPYYSDTTRLSVVTLATRDGKITRAGWLKNLEFRLPPIALLSSNIVDVATGKMPPAQDDVFAETTPSVQNGWRFTPRAAFDYTRSGEFSFMVPVGTVTLKSGVRPEFRQAYSSAAQTVKVRTEGLQGVVVKVRRNANVPLPPN